MNGTSNVMKNILFSVILLCMAVLPLLDPSPGQAGPQKVTVFAAASTTNALADIAAQFTAQTQIEVVPSFASSSTLAKQIESGAPADLFISADEKWMDYLAERNLIQPRSRTALLGNLIVLIAPADSRLPATGITAGSPLLKWLEDGRLVMGDPSHVPAGIYGQKALENLGLWAQVKDRIAPAKDVRAALTLVERAEAPLGLVYATDAAISSKVRVLGAFPESSHPPIVYPAALTAGHDSEPAQKFMAFLKSAAAKSIFEKYGFTVR